MVLEWFVDYPNYLLEKTNSKLNPPMIRLPMSSYSWILFPHLSLEISKLLPRIHHITHKFTESQIQSGFGLIDFMSYLSYDLLSQICILCDFTLWTIGTQETVKIIQPCYKQVIVG